MKYRITKYNIEFDVPDSELHSLIKCILEELVPNKIKTIHFVGKEGAEYPYLTSLEQSGLKIHGSIDSNSALLAKERIVHNDGYITLVPQLSGMVKEQEWRQLCKSIALRFTKSA